MPLEDAILRVCHAFFSRRAGILTKGSAKEMEHGMLHIGNWLFGLMILVSLVGLGNNISSANIEESTPTFDRTKLKQHQIVPSTKAYDCAQIEEKPGLSVFAKLCPGGAKSFKLEYDLRSDSRKVGNWLLRSKLSSGDEQCVWYYVDMTANADVVSEKTVVKEVKKTGVVPGAHGTTEKATTMMKNSQEKMTVSEEERSYFGKSMGISKVIRFREEDETSKNGEPEGTELSIPKDEIVLTFFQIPIFAGTIKEMPKDGVPFRCVYRGQPFPAVLKSESDDSGNVAYSVYRSKHALSLIPAEGTKPIFRLFYVKSDSFSLPIKIIVDLNGNRVSLTPSNK